MQEEYDELEAEFVEYRRQIGATSKGNAAKEVRALKAIIKNLEQDIAQDRIKHQKLTSKRGQQYRRLADEVCVLYCGRYGCSVVKVDSLMVDRCMLFIERFIL